MVAGFLRFPLGLLTVCLLTLAAWADAPERWVLIETTEKTITIVEGREVRAVFEEVAYGRGGVSELHQRGDGSTPRGTYRIAWINRSSRYRLFFGLDYPSHAQAELAFQRGLIDFDTYYRIRRALFKGGIPPQDTELGGYIGIHGLGDGDETVHRESNWTKGCVALTNDQIDHFAEWARVGTRVVIR